VVRDYHVELGGGLNLELRRLGQDIDEFLARLGWKTELQ
jgi:hypothetical protein